MIRVLAQFFSSVRVCALEREDLKDAIKNTRIRLCHVSNPRSLDQTGCSGTAVPSIALEKLGNT